RTSRHRRRPRQRQRRHLPPSHRIPRPLPSLLLLHGCLRLLLQQLQQLRKQSATLEAEQSRTTTRPQGSTWCTTKASRRRSPKRRAAAACLSSGLAGRLYPFRKVLVVVIIVGEQCKEGMSLGFHHRIAF